MDLKFVNPQSAEQLMKDNLLVKHYAGSHAYGTNIATSDVDFRGIFCSDPVNLLTPFFPIRECSDTTEEDTKFYELSHFMKLCVECNPNIIETLWVDNKDIIQTSPAYEHLRNNREALLSSKVAFTFSGYATAQLKRIKGHNKWISNPQSKEPPHQTDFITLIQWYGENKIFNRDFKLTNYSQGYRLIPYGGDVYGLYETTDNFTTFQPTTYSLNTLYEGDRETLPLPLAVIKFNKEEYKRAKEKHEQYWVWKENRNETRSKLEKQFLYDTKHAMHLVRLLRMGVEILKTGQVIVHRPDAKELLEIRNGSWTYDELVKYAENLDKQVRNELYHTTSLRKKPNIKEAARILMETLEIAWKK